MEKFIETAEYLYWPRIAISILLIYQKCVGRVDVVVELFKILQLFYLVQL